MKDKDTVRDFSRAALAGCSAASSPGSGQDSQRRAAGAAPAAPGTAGTRWGLRRPGGGAWPGSGGGRRGRRRGLRGGGGSCGPADARARRGSVGGGGGVGAGGAAAAAGARARRSADRRAAEGKPGHLAAQSDPGSRRGCSAYSLQANKTKPSTRECDERAFTSDFGNGVQSLSVAAGVRAISKMPWSW